MIVRRWSARLPASNLEGYTRFFRSVVLPQLEALSGFVDAAVMTSHPRAAETAVVVETRWTSLDAIRAFAGADITRAVVEPEAARLFTDYDDRVAHYEVLL